MASITISVATRSNILEWLVLIQIAPSASNAWFYPAIYSVLDRLDSTIRHKAERQIRQRSWIEQEHLENLCEELETLDQAKQDQFLNCIKRGVV